jgi:uncharacterized repeat protein (TIGR03803 family)
MIGSLCTDGEGSSGVLVQATNGDFYGATWAGGEIRYQTTCGTVFRMTPAGKLTTLHRFNGTDGESPNGLIQAADGNLYGATFWGGSGSCSNQTASEVGCGTIFRITPAGALTTLYSFGGTDGAWPGAPLTQA